VSLAAPGFLVAAFAVAAAAVALHLLVLRPPPAARLPTARFVPPAASLVRRWETWPRDRALLALRVATILLAGLAFAGPALSARRARGTRLIAFDSSSTVARDSATRYRRSSDLLVPFDTSLSAALVGARRAVALRREDSVELVIISPFAVSAIDAATAAIRAQWPAAIRTVRVAAAPGSSRPAAVRWLPSIGDTVGAVMLDGSVTVAPFTRSRDGRLADGVVIARWVDGAPAAVERPAGDSCERDIAIGMPSTRDAVRLRLALTTRPCGAPPGVAMSDTALAAFAGTGAFSARFGANHDRAGDRTLVTVLLVLACALAVAEWVIRR
jgi:hypothetical protein